VGSFLSLLILVAIGSVSRYPSVRSPSADPILPTSCSCLEHRCKSCDFVCFFWLIKSCGLRACRWRIWKRFSRWRWARPRSCLSFLFEQALPSIVWSHIVGFGCLCGQTRVPLRQQQLHFNGKEMQNSEKLSSVGVQDGDLVMMLPSNERYPCWPSDQQVD
jgi:hypothetical protein